MLKKHRDGKLWVISGVTEYRVVSLDSVYERATT
jgi:hypothetical protein